MGDCGRSKCKFSCNENDVEYEGLHQPGGTGVRITGTMTQYVRHKHDDPRKLGRYSSVVLWANPNKKCRFVSIYNICKGKTKGLRTQYQQISRYMQRKSIFGVEPRQLFDSDFAKQCACWIKSGESLCVVGDVNDDVVSGAFTQLLAKEGIDLEEFGEDFCQGQDVDSHMYGRGRIVGGWKTRDLEITQLLVLPFMQSVGDHRSWIIEFTTRSILGPNLMRTQRSVARRLVTSNVMSTKRFNMMVKKLFGEHRITDRLEKLVVTADSYKHPVPHWLERKIQLFHVEMDQLRMRASDKCRKILTPVAPCGPEIRHWNDMIHMYKALFRILTRPHLNHNCFNTYRVGRKKGIENPQELTLYQVVDAISVCKIEQEKARLRATPSREEMQKKWIQDAADKEDHAKIRAIKGIMNAERSKRCWSIINATVNDPRPPPMTEIGREEGGKTVWYKDEKGVRMVIEEECEKRYNLARKAPVMRSELAPLNESDSIDLDLAKSLLEGDKPLPEDLDEPTKVYLKELVDICQRNPREFGRKFEFTKSKFVKFWSRVNEHTQSSASGHHYGFYKAASRDSFGSKAHALQLTLVARSGVPPPR